MPLYTYECPMGHRFEDIGSFDAVTAPCLVCEAEYYNQGGTVPHIEVTAKRVPSIPAPAKFNCSMPTYQRPKR